MDDTTLLGLATVAGGIGFFHTLTGPDHYVPFIAMSRVRHWSLPRTLAITVACGVGHVGSSVVLGTIGIALGLAVSRLERFEGARGDVAGWLLLGFGLAYAVWGLKRAIRNRPHTHVHAHGNGALHVHPHGHDGGHAHPHDDGESAQSITPWVLFTIFVFGPCEPLIPLLMFPAAKLSWWGVVLVTLVFAACTLSTMLLVVTVGYYGLSKLSLGWLGRYSHAIAGLSIAACGAAIQLGL